MARKAFYSFHYIPDNWRASQVRSMGVIEGNPPATDNDWEAVKRGGDPAIKNWIDRQLNGKSVAIVLIGAETAGRKWIKYEIEQAWNGKKGVLGIYIHNLKDRNGNQIVKGKNPFTPYSIDGVNMSRIVQSYDPPYVISKDVYAYIQNNLEAWIEKAIEIRGTYA